MERKVVGGLFPTSKSTIDWSTGDCSAESYGKLGGAENYLTIKNCPLEVRNKIESWSTGASWVSAAAVGNRAQSMRALVARCARLNN